MKDIEYIIEYNRQISPNTYEMKMVTTEVITAHCGQFVNVEVPNSPQLILRRPFCVYKFDEHSVTIIYVVVGKGTAVLAALVAGIPIRAITAIGNGFTLDSQHKKVVLIGGGIGSAPLASVPKCYPDRQFYSFLGFPNAKNVCFEQEFKEFSTEIFVCTDDGSAGFSGYPTAKLHAEIARIAPDVILTCGNEHFMKAVAKVAHEFGVPAYMSSESRMGCGVGACLVCTCAIKQPNGEVKNKRACVDGPVFRLEDIIL